MLWECCTYAHIGRLFIFQLSVNVTQAVRVALLHAYRVKACCCSPMVGLYMTSIQVTCVWTVALHVWNGQVHELWEPITLTGQTFGLCTWIRIFARQASGGNSIIIADLAPRTVRLIVHCLNIQLWGAAFLHFQTKGHILASYNNGRACNNWMPEGMNHLYVDWITVRLLWTWCWTFRSNKMWGISWLPQGLYLTFSIAEIWGRSFYIQHLPFITSPCLWAVGWLCHIILLESWQDGATDSWTESLSD